MSKDPDNGKLNNPASLHRYLYAGGDPVSALDPTGRAELFETSLIEGGSLRAGIVPALVEFVGNYVVLPAIRFSVSAAEVVAEYAQDAWAVIKSYGLFKWYVCAELGADAATAIDDVFESDATDQQKEYDADQISELTEKACGFLLFDER
jgi:hypothetical protein